jgi:hypothetical protein
VGVPRTQAALRGQKRGDAVEPLTTIAAAKRALVRVKRATGIDGTCLSRSLALATMLQRRGISTELRVGYRRKDGIIEGHAWLEYAGKPINERPDVVATYTLASHSTAFDETLTKRARWV